MSYTLSSCTAFAAASKKASFVGGAATPSESGSTLPAEYLKQDDQTQPTSVMPKKKRVVG